MLLFWILWRLLIVVNGFQGRSRCSEGCGHGVEHTMCKFTKPNEKCLHLKLKPPSIIRDNLLIWHNLVRNNFASGSKFSQSVNNMKKVYWDDELEEMAIRWVSQCEPAHDLCRKLPGLDVGQNIGLSTLKNSYQNSPSSFFDWVSTVDYNELENWNESLLSSEDRPIDQLAQIIRADTFLLGCAEASYERNNTFYRLLVCNYGSPIKLKGMKLYDQGPPCSNCPLGTNCASIENNEPFTSLCLDPQREESEDERLRNALASDLIRHHVNNQAARRLDDKAESMPEATILWKNQFPYLVPVRPNEIDKMDDPSVYQLDLVAVKNWLNALNIRKQEGYWGSSQIPHAVVIYRPTIIIRGCNLQKSSVRNDDYKEKKHGLLVAGRSLSDSHSLNKQISNLARHSRYCQIRCTKGRHIMCRPKVKSKSCQIDSIAEEHIVKKCVIPRLNKLRNEVAGGIINPSLLTAANMRKLIWDEELVDLALKWASQCPMSPHKCTNVERFPVHQIVMSSVFSESNKKTYCAETLDTHISLLVKKLNPALLNASTRQGKVIHNLIQLVQAQSGHIGCAEVAFTKFGKGFRASGNDESLTKYFTLVCNFENNVNTDERSAYLDGEPCTKCPNGTFCRARSRFPYLCE